MKKLISLIIILISLVVFHQSTAKEKGVNTLGYIDIRNKYQSGQRVIVGILSGQDLSSPTSWANQLKVKLQTKNPQSDVVVISTAGWTTANHINNGSVGQLASRTPKPDVVFVYLTNNDFRTVSFSTFASNYRTLMNAIESNGMVAIASKEHEITASSSVGNNYYRVLEEVDILCKRTGRQTHNVFSATKTRRQYEGRTLLESDGVTLNQEGQDYVAERWLRWFKIRHDLFTQTLTDACVSVTNMPTDPYSVLGIELSTLQHPTDPSTIRAFWFSAFGTSMADANNKPQGISIVEANNADLTNWTFKHKLVLAPERFSNQRYYNGYYYSIGGIETYAGDHYMFRSSDGITWQAWTGSGWGALTSKQPVLRQGDASWRIFNATFEIVEDNTGTPIIHLWHDYGYHTNTRLFGGYTKAPLSNPSQLETNKMVNTGLKFGFAAPYVKYIPERNAFLFFVADYSDIHGDIDHPTTPANYLAGYSKIGALYAKADSNLQDPNSYTWSDVLEIYDPGIHCSDPQAVALPSGKTGKVLFHYSWGQVPDTVAGVPQLYSNYNFVELYDILTETTPTLNSITYPTYLKSTTFLLNSPLNSAKIGYNLKSSTYIDALCTTPAGAFGTLTAGQTYEKDLWEKNESDIPITVIFSDQLSETNFSVDNGAYTSTLTLNLQPWEVKQFKVRIIPSTTGKTFDLTKTIRGWSG
ncbi:MAG TPA: SGNH/GDSL hydrolase family protein [Flavobacterium sp.]|nr:SGNH/GDSL hydrolase family protein [Flavobacterium sp.]